MREYAYQRNRELFRSPGLRGVRLEDGRPLRPKPGDDGRRTSGRSTPSCSNAAPGLFTRLAIEQALFRATIQGARLGLLCGRAEAAAIDGRGRGRPSSHRKARRIMRCRARPSMPAGLAPQPALDAIQADLTGKLSSPPASSCGGSNGTSSIGFGGDLDRCRADARLDERLDDADPESRRHARHRREHGRRHPRARPRPRPDLGRLGAGLPTR